VFAVVVVGTLDTLHVTPPSSEYMMRLVAALDPPTQQTTRPRPLPSVGE
jgi:hypothetical protein